MEKKSKDCRFAWCWLRSTEKNQFLSLHCFWLDLSNASFIPGDNEKLTTKGAGKRSFVGTVF